ncbi:hypothetical protein [Sulfitobacter sp.]|jgi:hypothetical protein|uniref:hypothetical protein n=1 Tax=Sulfitobacter sp. TaxID=1903071 RepID=UPI0039E3B3CB
MRWMIPLAIFACTPAVGQETSAAAVADEHSMAETLTLETAPFRQEIKRLCNFVTECVENEPCTETEFTPEITGIGGGLSADDLVVQAEMVTDAETVELLGVTSGKSLSLSGGTFAARHMITITENGATRYTVHYADGPFVISYLGTCN